MLNEESLYVTVSAVDGADGGITCTSTRQFRSQAEADSGGT